MSAAGEFGGSSMNRWAKRVAVIAGLSVAVWFLAYRTTEFLVIAAVYLLVRQEMDSRTIDDVEERVRQIDARTGRALLSLRKEVSSVRDMAVRDMGVME